MVVHLKIDVFVKFDSFIIFENKKSNLKKKSIYLAHRDHKYAVSTDCGSDMTWNDKKNHEPVSQSYSFNATLAHASHKLYLTIEIF